MKKYLGVILLLFVALSAHADELEVSGQKLPYWPAKEPHYGAIIIVNGGEPGQWSDFLSRLAPELGKNGWSTLLVNTSNTGPWIEQLPEAINVLRKNKNDRIGLIHYSEQLNLTFDYFSKPQGKMINGLVLLSAYDKQGLASPPPNFRFPIFDVTGQFDYEFVTTQMNERKNQLQAVSYLSLVLPGSHHDYRYNEAFLAGFISGWMEKLTENEPQAPPIGS